MNRFPGGTGWWIPVGVLVATLAMPAWAGDGIVALQSADPSCADDSGNTYVNCGNGTVTDNRTGLVWLKSANCLGEFVEWNEAMEFVAGLSDKPGTSVAAADDCGLSDGSSPGEWRLPSIEEWEAMTADARVLGCEPAITDDRGDDCWSSTLECFLQDRTCSFSDVASEPYWSSTTCVDATAEAWLTGLTLGNFGCVIKFATLLVWPVRGGQ